MNSTRSEPVNGEPDERTDPVPEALIEPRARYSKVWLVPLLAAMIGLGMFVNEWQQRGVSVEISFETAEGLEPGETLVKYRSVEVGRVESISFSEDRRRIIVEISLSKAMRPLLREDTLFWVERPRIGAAGVSGFGTLMSGAYIAISPGVDEKASYDFIGLEEPPISSPTTPGLRLLLTSSGVKPVRVGNPVMHRGFRVGQVETAEFDTETRTARYDVFIQEPYQSLVTTNTYFWNISGASVNTTSTGVSVEVGTVETLISGGLEFDVPEGVDLGKRVVSGHQFALFESKKSVLEGRKYRYIEYVVLVEDSVGGLTKGAPVEFRGIRIGTVERAQINLGRIGLNDEEGIPDHRIPVLIRIEPERVLQRDQFSLDEFAQQIDEWILEGLTASIETANFLTGALKVTMDINGSAKSTLLSYEDHTVIPATPGGVANLTEKVESILSKVDALPIATTVQRLNTVLATADQTMIDLQTTLSEAEATLQSVRPDADFYQSIESSLNEFDRTMDKLQPLIQELNNQPNALIFGGRRAPDPEPKALQSTSNE